MLDFLAFELQILVKLNIRECVNQMSSQRKNKLVNKQDQIILKSRTLKIICENSMIHFYY